MKPVLIIDPFVKVPVNHCFNRLVQIYAPRPCWIWQPVLLNTPSLPTDMKTKLDSIIILGAASHVYQQEPWHDLIGKFVLKHLKQDVPVLGICFGHQLMAHFFGGTVDYAYDNQDKILGTRIIKMQKSAHGTYLIGASHRQIVTALGKNLISLNHTTDPLFAHDLIKHKRYPFLGIQPHIEASDHFLKNDCHIESKAVRKKCLNDGKKFLLSWQGFL
jgi:GMP synthase-like glutamine amidotransferase